MPKMWVPPRVFMRLDRRDAVIYYAYKDDDVRSVLLYVYNMSYNEDESRQFDVRDLMAKLSRASLPLSDEKKLQRCIEQSKHDNGTRTWHRGIIRLAWHYRLLP